MRESQVARRVRPRLVALVGRAGLTAVFLNRGIGLSEQVRDALEQDGMILKYHCGHSNDTSGMTGINRPLRLRLTDAIEYLLRHEHLEPS